MFSSKLVTVGIVLCLAAAKSQSKFARVAILPIDFAGVRLEVDVVSFRVDGIECKQRFVGLSAESIPFGHYSAELSYKKAPDFRIFARGLVNRENMLVVASESPNRLVGEGVAVALDGIYPPVSVRGRIIAGSRPGLLWIRLQKLFEPSIVEDVLIGLDGSFSFPSVSRGLCVLSVFSDVNLLYSRNIFVDYQLQGVQLKIDLAAEAKQPERTVR